MFKTDYSKKLLKAVKNNDLVAAERALGNEADVNTKDREGLTPLMWAVNKNHLIMVQLLISKGADINAQDNRGYTAAIIAVFSSNLTSLVELITNNANLDIQDNEKNTALMRAAWNNSGPMVDELIKGGASLNLQNENGNTALIHAARWGYANIASALLEAGADPEITDNKGYTAILRAQSEKRLGAVRTFELFLNKNNTQENNHTDKEKWEKMGNDRIAFTGIYPKPDKKITEIFNFASRQQIITVERLSKDIATTPAVISFQQLDKSVIENALEQFKKHGGSADESFVIHGKALINKPSKPL